MKPKDNIEWNLIAEMMYKIGQSLESKNFEKYLQPEDKSAHRGLISKWIGHTSIN